MSIEKLISRVSPGSVSVEMQNYITTELENIIQAVNALIDLIDHTEETGVYQGDNISLLENDAGYLSEVVKETISDFVEADYVHIENDETINGLKTFNGRQTFVSEVVIDSGEGGVSAAQLEFKEGGDDHNTFKISANKTGQFQVFGKVDPSTNDFVSFMHWYLDGSIRFSSPFENQTLEITEYFVTIGEDDVIFDLSDGSVKTHNVEIQQGGSNLNTIGQLRIGADLNADTLTDNTMKAFLISEPHYDIDEEDFCIAWIQSAASQNRIIFGGGHGNTNAATNIEFNVASDRTTLVGTQVLSLTISRIKASIPIELPVFALANVPSASTAARLIYISNGAAGNPALAISDGSNWKVIDVSALPNAS